MSRWKHFLVLLFFWEFAFIAMQHFYWTRAFRLHILIPHPYSLADEGFCSLGKKEEREYKIFMLVSIPFPNRYRVPYMLSGCFGCHSLSRWFYSIGKNGKLGLGRICYYLLFFFATGIKRELSGIIHFLFKLKYSYYTLLYDL